MIPFKPTVVSKLWNTASEDEYLWWPRCLWIDPGLSSGYCVVWFDPYVLMGYARSEVREEIRRSGKGKAGGSERKTVIVGGEVSSQDLRPQSSVRSVLAWQAGQTRGEDNDQIADLLDLAERLGGRGLLVGCEGFEVRRIDTSEAFLAPARIAAVLKFELAKGLRNRGDEQTKFDKKRLHKQSPSEALTTITDTRLKLWEMYTPGPDHPRDATRHALLHLRKLMKAGRDAVENLYGWEDGWQNPYGEE